MITREGDLRDQRLVRQHALGGVRHGARDEQPEDHSGHREHRVGNPRLRGDLSQEPEEDAEDGRQKERLEDRPEDADRGLLVARGDLPAGKVVREVPVPPKLAQVRETVTPGGLDDSTGCCKRLHFQT
jgi:hypothetical protein